MFELRNMLKAAPFVNLNSCHNAYSYLFHKKLTTSSLHILEEFDHNLLFLVRKN